MNVTKAVITSANPVDKHLPLQTLIDSKGETRTALQILLAEVFSAGLEAAAIVIPPGEEERYQLAAGPYAERLTFIEQKEALGYGHAVSLAAEFVGEAPFLLLVGDHLFRSLGETSCVQQIIALAKSENATISGVQPTHESQLHLYGTVAATLRAGTQHTYDVSSISEKPTPTLAEQELIVPGLRAGHYLCFFGMHVLPAKAIDHLLARLEKTSPSEKIGLTETLNFLADNGEYLALRIDGQRFNLGERYGLLRAQLALSLAGPHRDEVMATIIELLA
ncbi:sugar phosphate nucleotidyltransferase [Roseibacillus persicicus]|uniref:sugar phosphate nucleotidyltransferase n=1 Tax=Roseibacillus persicicus TaxID=454148 RepID=UPI00398B4B04